MKSIAYAIVLAASMACTTFGNGPATAGPLFIGVVAWVALLCGREK